MGVEALECLCCRCYVVLQLGKCQEGKTQSKKVAAQWSS